MTKEARQRIRASTPISIEPGTRLIRIERVLFSEIDGVRRDASWFLWINTRDFVHGTGIRLYGDGRMERVTVYEDGTEDILTIKGADTT